MPRARRLLSPILLALLLLAAATTARVAPALASGSQETIFQDQSLGNDAAGRLAILRGLGVQRVRVFVVWGQIAPRPGSHTRPRSFNPTDPAAYPRGNWSVYDNIVTTAAANGIAVDFTLTGPAPLWATGSGFPGPSSLGGTWKPSAHEFGSFVRAVGTRYSGSYSPDGVSTLPKVGYWAIWNEPNYGQDLAPQSTRGGTVEVAPAIYRGLVDAGWGALRSSSAHRHDTVLVGEIAPRGQTSGGLPGNFGGMVPLRFLRALYCVDSSYQPLRGRDAARRGCPTNASGSRRFYGAHKALFQATGFAAHLYPQAQNPTVQTWPNRGANQYADLPQEPTLERVLDRLNRTYGSHTRFAVYNTEYGLRTNPPEGGQPSPSTAALYLNWAEYLSWRNPRLKSYAQYLLVDAPQSSYPSGLEDSRSRPKATFAAFRMPIYLPSTSTRGGRSLEVWGAVRPAHFAPGSQPARIQFRRGSRGSFTTLRTVTVRGGGNEYFDVRVKFPASGSVRIEWTDASSGTPIHSRTQAIRLR